MIARVTKTKADKLKEEKKEENTVKAILKETDKWT